MSKVDIIILKSTGYFSAIGLFLDLPFVVYLKFQKMKLVRSLETTILVNKWWEICISLLVLFIPLFILSAICLLLIYRRKKQPIVHYNSVKESITDLVPTLRKTSQSYRELQPIVISENFKDLFMPDFCKTNEIGINPFTIMTEQLEKGSWTLTNLGRIARMCYQADAKNPQYQHFNDWMKEFFTRLGRTDCPASPEKKNYKVTEDSYLLKMFTCIVRYGEKKNADYLKLLSK